MKNEEGGEREGGRGGVVPWYTYYTRTRAVATAANDVDVIFSVFEIEFVPR